MATVTLGNAGAAAQSMAMAMDGADALGTLEQVLPDRGISVKGGASLALRRPAAP